MKRWIFFILLFTSVLGSACVVLWAPGFWEINLTGEAGIAAGDGNGWDMMTVFFNNITESGMWEWNVFNALIWSTAFFLFLMALTLLILILIFIINKGKPNNSRRLYRNTVWFFVGAAVLSAAYIWFVVEIMDALNYGAYLWSQERPFSWSIRTLPFWFYIPIGLSLILVILSIIFRATDSKNKG